MTMQAWVPAGKDELIVNVTGANPGTRQTATLSLWSGRSPTAAASGAIGSLAQTWADNSQTGALRARRSARWPRSPPAGRTSPRRW